MSCGIIFSLIFIFSPRNALFDWEINLEYFLEAVSVQCGNFWGTKNLLRSRKIIIISTGFCLKFKSKFYKILISPVYASLWKFLTIDDKTRLQIKKKKIQNTRSAQSHSRSMNGHHRRGCDRTFDLPKILTRQIVFKINFTYIYKKLPSAQLFNESWNLKYGV